MPMIDVVYHTDPLCPWSWAAEPTVRRIQVEFGDQVAFTYVMAGMAKETDPAQLLSSTLKAAADKGAASDPRIWLDGAPRSSFPACLAVKAASEQGRDADYLRRLREGTFCRRERLDGVEAFLAAARDVEGLDAGRFEIDLRSNAIVELFGADRERSQAACGDDRPALPAFTVAGSDEVLGEEGLRAAIVAAGATPGPLPSAEDALARFGVLTTAEAAEVCGVPRTRARVELWRLAGEFRARPTELVCGELWQTA